MTATLRDARHENASGAGSGHESHEPQERVSNGRAATTSDVPAPITPMAFTPGQSLASTWLSRACVIVPALDAERTLPSVIQSLRTSLPFLADAIYVIDDGSRDRTASVAARLGCEVLSHGRNRGKGAALRAGLATALARGCEVALTVDADGQHPGEDACRVMLASDDPEALVLGIRDLDRAGAPKKNRFSNGISNMFLSRFAGRPLRDTQCGLRRYPVRRTLALGAHGEGYDFEGEILLRAAWAGVTIVEEPIEVLYPEDRVTHFHVVRDPFRIVRTVVAALGERRLRG